MSAVLGQQEENANDAEEPEHQLGARRPGIMIGFDRFGHGYCSVAIWPLRQLRGLNVPRVRNVFQTMFSFMVMTAPSCNSIAAPSFM